LTESAGPENSPIRSIWQDLRKPITLLIADQHPIVREGIMILCSSQPALQIVGECTNGAEAVESVLALNPDFAVLELDMPGMTGLEATRRIRKANSRARILILSMTRDEPVVRELFDNGADGYLLKDAPARHLFDAISHVLDGGHYLTPSIGWALTDETTEETGPLALLTRREREVFGYLVKGRRPKEIAKIMNISPKTVDTYRAKMTRKLKVYGTAELVRLGLERKLHRVTPPNAGNP
jgi:DNA-binding NarL/FixJ family response regulator